MRAQSLLGLLAILLAGCGGAPPVTATKVLDLTGLDENLRAVALAADGSSVVTSNMNGTLVARDVPAGTERWRVSVHAPGSSASIDTLALSSDTRLLALSGNESPAVELRDARTGEPAGDLPMRGVRALVFHPSEEKLVVGESAMLHVIDAGSLEIERSIPDAHLGDKLYAASFSRDGRILATASEHGLVKLWDWPALTERAAVTMKASVRGPPAPVSVAVAREGTHFAANAMEGDVHLMDTTPGSKPRILPNQATAPGHWHVEMYRSLAFLGDGEWLLAPAEHDTGLRIVDAIRGKSYDLFRGQVPYYKGIAFSSTGGMAALIHPGLASGTGPDGIQVWKLDLQPGS